MFLRYSFNSPNIVSVARPPYRPVLDSLISIIDILVFMWKFALPYLMKPNARANGCVAFFPHIQFSPMLSCDKINFAIYSHNFFTLNSRNSFFLKRIKGVMNDKKIKMNRMSWGPEDEMTFFIKSISKLIQNKKV